MISEKPPARQARSRPNHDSFNEPSSKRRSTSTRGVSAAATNESGRSKLDDRLRSVLCHQYGVPLTCKMHGIDVPSHFEHSKLKSYAFPKAAAVAEPSADTDTAKTVNHSLEMDQASVDFTNENLSSEGPTTESALENLLETVVNEFYKKKEKKRQQNMEEKRQGTKPIENHSTAGDTETPGTGTSDANVEPPPPLEKNSKAITEVDLTKAIASAIEAHSAATNFHSYSEVSVDCTPPTTETETSEDASTRRKGRMDILLSESNEKEKALTAPLTIIEVGLDDGEFFAKASQVIDYSDGIFDNSQEGQKDEKPFNRPIMNAVLTIEGEDIDNLKIKLGVFMCWPNPGKICRVMMLWHELTSKLKDASRAFGRCLRVAFLLAKYRSGGDGEMDYEYLSPNCSRFGKVSVLL